MLGLLAEVTVERGDQVTKGQVIAKLESEVDKLNIALNRARATAKAEIEAQQERLALSRKTLERAQRLTSNAVTRQRIDELESEVIINERELASTKLRQRLAILELERAEALLEQRSIKSPEDGVVIERALSPGEFVDTNSYVVQLAKMDPLFVEAFLPVAYYLKMREGMTAFVEPEEPIGGRHKARVSTIDRVFDSASSTFGVRLELPNPEKRLPAGLRGRVIFAFE